ncbi:MAG: acetyl-CoA carboxylase biotin carboxyl carrier protein [Bryobacterales bacterium]
MPPSTQRAKPKMTLDEIKDLIETVIAKDITEFEFESGGEKIRICREGSSPRSNAPPPYVIVTSPQVAPGAFAPQGNPGTAPPAASSSNEQRAPEKAAEKEAEMHMVTAPIVGTFYEASSPGGPALVQVGDKVQAGQVLCIIEAMKLMNEIEAEASGVVKKRFVSNGQPVEYGEALFAIDTRG